MEDMIKNAYREPGHQTFYSGIQNVYKYWKQREPSLTISKVKEILSSIEGYTKHKQNKRDIKNVTFIYYKRQVLQGDLIEIQNLASENDNYRYILNFIDCFTRFCWCEPLRDKKTKTVIFAFKKILDSAITKPKSVFLDAGSEFTNKSFRQFCADNGIKLYIARSFGKAAFVERLNLTLKRKIYAYMTDNETYNFINKLPDIVKSYNNAIHSALPDISPNEAEHGNAELDYQIRQINEVKYLNARKHKPRFNLGDEVRVSLSKNVFHRGFKDQFADEIFRIKNIDKKLPKPRYTLEDFNKNEEITGQFSNNELQKVKKTIFVIENVIRKRKVGKKTELLVKFRGYKQPEWIQESQLVDSFKE